MAKLEGTLDLGVPIAVAEVGMKHRMLVREEDQTDEGWEMTVKSYNDIKTHHYVLDTTSRSYNIYKTQFIDQTSSYTATDNMDS